MRGDKNLRRAGRGAAASKAWAEFTSGGEAADPAVTAAQHVASHGGKDVAGEAVKHAWHTAPWESAKAAFGAKGAAVLAVVGGAAAIGLVAVATVAVAGGGGKGGDDVEISSDGKDGVGRDIGSGGKDGDDDDTTTSGDEDDATTSASTDSSTTTSTVPGQTTTTGRSSTPGGGVTTSRPTGTTRTTVTTRPPATRPTTTAPTTTRPVPPTVRFDYTFNYNCRTDLKNQIDVTFTWASNGATATLTPSGGKSMTVNAAEGKYQTCTHPGHVWTLKVVGANGAPTSKTVTPQRPL